jgi:nucleoside-triphosphatase THEP1
LVISNPASLVADKQGLVRLAGFRIPYSRKLDFGFDSRQSPAVTAHFCAEFEELFESSTKFVLLTAEPRVGKTKAFLDLISSTVDDERIYSVVSVAEYESGSRTSFSAYSSVDPERKVNFAQKNLLSGFPELDVRQYDLQNEVWDHFAKEIREARFQKKIIVIDEIGEMQLQSAKFCEEIRELLVDPQVTVFATLAMDETRHSLIREINQHHRTTVLQMTTDNQDVIARTLKSEFEKALRLQEYLSNE